MIDAATTPSEDAPEGAPESAPAAPPQTPAVAADEAAPVEAGGADAATAGDVETSSASEAGEAVVEEAVAEETGAAEPLAETAAPPRFDFSDLRGFQFLVAASHEDAEAFRTELEKELVARVARFAQSVDDSIVLASDGVIRWLGDPIARLVQGDELLKPRAVLLADDAMPAESRTAAETRLGLWITAHVRKVLGPLEALVTGEGAPEGAHELARRVAEALGVLDRERVRQQVKALDQNARAALRKLGVRFGAHYIFVPTLLKPGARTLCSQLWALRRGSEPGAERLLAYAAAGRTSFAAEGALSPDSYRVAGFRLCGERVVRVDIVERLTDLIRAAIPDQMRPGSAPASDAAGFVVTQQMTSLTGCAGEAFASILKSLGYESHKVLKADFEAATRKPAPAATEPAAEAPAHVEAEPHASDAAEAHAEAEAAHDGAVEPAEAESVQADTAAVAEIAEPEAVAAPEEPAAAEPAEAVAAEAPIADAPAEDAARPVEAGEPEAVAAESAETAGESPEPAAAEAAAATEEWVEVWRPAPRRRPEHPRRHGGHAAEGTGRIVWRAKEPRRPAPETAKPAAAEGAAEGASAEAAAGEPAREARTHEGGRHRHGHRPPFKGPRSDDRRGQDERRRDDRRGDRGPKEGAHPPRKEPRPQTIDPDSPFAKLLALKPLLERRDKNS